MFDCTILLLESNLPGDTFKGVYSLTSLVESNMVALPLLSSTIGTYYYALFVCNILSLESILQGDTFKGVYSIMTLDGVYYGGITSAFVLHRDLLLCTVCL